MPDEQLQPTKIFSHFSNSFGLRSVDRSILFSKNSSILIADACIGSCSILVAGGAVVVDNGVVVVDMVEIVISRDSSSVLSFFG